MKALVLEEYGQFALRDYPQPQAGPGEVLIRVAACGICGSDVHGMDGSTGRRRPPVVMGHEAAGVIAAVGEGVADWQVGHRVTFDSTVYCGACHFCRRGRINLCDNRRVLGVSCEEYRQDGAFAEYVVVPQHILYAVPENVSLAQAAMVEPVSIALHAVARTPLALNDSALVVGAGMIGLLVVQALRAAGCGTVIAVDLDDGKLEMAADLGADRCINAGEDVPARVAAWTGGRGVDAAFEVVGIAPTIDSAIQSTRKGGSVTLVGNLSPEVALPLQSVVTREITLYGSCASCGEYPACLDLMARGVINVDPLMSGVAPLEEGNDWFQRLYNKEPGLMKVLLQPSGEEE